MSVPFRPSRATFNYTLKEMCCLYHANDSINTALRELLPGKPEDFNTIAKKLLELARTHGESCNRASTYKMIRQFNKLELPPAFNLSIRDPYPPHVTSAAPLATRVRRAAIKLPPLSLTLRPLEQEVHHLIPTLPAHRKSIVSLHKRTLAIVLKQKQLEISAMDRDKRALYITQRSLQYVAENDKKRAAVRRHSPTSPLSPTFRLTPAQQETFRKIHTDHMVPIGVLRSLTPEQTLDILNHYDKIKSIIIEYTLSPGILTSVLRLCLQTNMTLEYFTSLDRRSSCLLAMRAKAFLTMARALPELIEQLQTIPPKRINFLLDYQSTIMKLTRISDLSLAYFTNCPEPIFPVLHANLATIEICQQKYRLTEANISSIIMLLTMSKLPTENLPQLHHSDIHAICAHPDEFIELARFGWIDLKELHLLPKRFLCFTLSHWKDIKYIISDLGVTINDLQTMPVDNAIALVEGLDDLKTQLYSSSRILKKWLPNVIFLLKTPTITFADLLKFESSLLIEVLGYYAEIDTLIFARALTFRDLLLLTKAQLILIMKRHNSCQKLLEADFTIKIMTSFSQPCLEQILRFPGATITISQFIPPTEISRTPLNILRLLLWSPESACELNSLIGLNLLLKLGESRLRIMLNHVECLTPMMALGITERQLAEADIDYLEMVFGNIEEALEQLKTKPFTELSFA